MMHFPEGTNRGRRSAAANQQAMHPAADIFRNYLLSEAEDENTKLHQDNTLLESAFKLASKIELRLRDGHVISTMLNLPLLATFDRSDGYLSIPIYHEARALAEFGSGGVLMLGQIVVGFPGTKHIVLGIRRNGVILLRFALSKFIAVEGIVQGLDDEDHSRFQNKLLGGNQITEYLTSGVGLRNPNAITFSPRMLLIEDNTPALQIALKLLHPLPSCESTKDALALDLERPRRSILPHLSPSNELRLSVVGALGHNEFQMDLLCKNRMLQNERRRLARIHETLGDVQISHSSFATRHGATLLDRATAGISIGSLKNGKLEYSEGSPVWCIDIMLPVSSNSITDENIWTLGVFLSEIRLTTPVRRPLFQMFFENETGLTNFERTYPNGLKISLSCRDNPQPDPFKLFMEVLVGTIQFPLLHVQNVLNMLEVKTH